MFGKPSNKKRAQQAIPEFADCMMQWGLDRETALRFGADFASKALESTEASLVKGMKEDVNLADLYLSGDVPKTLYGQLWTQVIKKYEPQRQSDGVTIDDFTWYWSMPLIERNLLHEMANAYRMGLSLMVIQSKVWESMDEALDKAKLECDLDTPAYGSIAPENLDTKDSTRLLPLELFGRIEPYRSTPWSDKDKALLRKLGNHNSFLREQMKKGII